MPQSSLVFKAKFRAHDPTRKLPVAFAPCLGLFPISFCALTLGRVGEQFVYNS